MLLLKAFLFTLFPLLIQQSWYCLSKTLAEKEAFNFANQNGLDVVAVRASLTLGPLLQPTVNASSMVLVNLMKGFCPLSVTN